MQFNPVKPYLRSSNTQQNYSIQNSIPRFENDLQTQASLPLDDNLFVPTKKNFIYAENPYEADILHEKENQVLLELKFLQQNQQLFEKLCTDTNQKIRANPNEMDTFQHSNVKWFETATKNIQEITHMTQVMNEQETLNIQSSLVKKDQIIEIADQKNEEYQR